MRSPTVGTPDIEPTGDAPGPAPLSIRAQRRLVTIALVLYPIGAFAWIALEDRNQALLIGGLPIALSLAAAILVLPASLRRIAGGPAARLDEFELMQRNRALGRCYSVVSAAFVGFLLFEGIAHEIDFPSPDGLEEYAGFAFVTLLFILLLPTAFLAWTLPEPVED